MENRTISKEAKQSRESIRDEAENLDIFINAIVQVVEKYGKLVLHELDCVA